MNASQLAASAAFGEAPISDLRMEFVPLHVSLNGSKKKNQPKEDRGKMMNRKLFVVVLALAFLTALPAARASEDTKLTFSRSVQIPGRVLAAGTYWFIVENPGSQVVRIFSEDRSTLYATILTASAENQEPADQTSITFAGQGAMHPQAIVTWFYPGRTIGHQFVYPKQQEKEFAKNQQQTVVAGD